MHFLNFADVAAEQITLRTALNTFTIHVVNQPQRLVQLDFGRGPTPHYYNFLGCRHPGSSAELVDYEDVIMCGFKLVLMHDNGFVTTHVIYDIRT